MTVVEGESDLDYEAERFYDAYAEADSAKTLAYVGAAMSAIRGMREEADLISELLTEEETVVASLFRILGRLERPLGWVSVDPAILAELGDVDLAHVTSDGRLLISRRDREVKTIDLFDRWNRDLLALVVRDLVPKLRFVLENPPEIEEPVVEESTYVELEPEPIDVFPEPEPAPVEEPFAEPTPEEEIISEPITEEIIEPEFVPEPEPQQPVIEEPASIEEPEEFTEPEIEAPIAPPAPPFEPLDEPVELPLVMEEPEKRERLKRERDAEILRHKKRVDAETQKVYKEMAEVRRRRDMELKALRGRIDVSEEPAEEPKKSPIRRLLNRLFGRL
jgi:hypothetical protein